MILKMRTKVHRIYNGNTWRWEVVASVGKEKKTLESGIAMSKESAQEQASSRLVKLCPKPPIP